MYPLHTVNTDLSSTIREVRSEAELTLEFGNPPESHLEYVVGRRDATMTPDTDPDRFETFRRTVLGGVAGLTASSVVGSAAASSDEYEDDYDGEDDVNGDDDHPNELQLNRDVVVDRTESRSTTIPTRIRSSSIPNPSSRRT